MKYLIGTGVILAGAVAAVWALRLLRFYKAFEEALKDVERIQKDWEAPNEARGEQSN